MPVLDLIPKKKKRAPRGAGARPIPVPRYTPALIPSPHEVPAGLARRLRALGQRFRFVRVTERVAQAVGIAVMLVTVQMFVDWLFDLPWLARAALLGGDLWLLATFGRKHLLPLYLRPPQLEACALMVEKQWPALKGRVIAAVQLARPSVTSHSPELVLAVQQEAEARTGSLNFGEIVPTRLLQRRLGLTLAVTIFWLVLMVLAAPGSLALLERFFLLPAKVPRKTEVICLSGNRIIPTGDGVLLEAEARGIIPAHGRITLVDDAGRIQEITLEPEPDHPERFSLQVDRVEQPLRYTIRLNDGVSDTYKVRTVPRPNVTAIDCTQVYPAYTGLDPLQRTVGNLALLAGSRLQIHAVANSPIVAAAIKLAGLDQTLPLTIGGPEKKELTGEIDIPAAGLTGFSLQLTNQAGITSGDETQYRIDLIPDRPPNIELTYPERLQELDTLKAKPTIAFVASDDYGLEKIALCYRLTDDADGANGDAGNAPATPPVVNRIELELGPGRPLTMKNHYVWDLAAVQPPLTEGITLEYWLEAQDANNVTGPGITESEHHTIKIASEMEKKAEVMNRLMDSLSTITDITQDQEKVNQDLGAAIQGKAVGP
jgi:hypothetical protein